MSQRQLAGRLGVSLGKTNFLIGEKVRMTRAYLARTEAESVRQREDFIRTLLERDLPQLALRVPAAAMRRFWTMLAHDAGGIWNGSQIGRSARSRRPRCMCARPACCTRCSACPIWARSRRTPGSK